MLNDTLACFFWGLARSSILAQLITLFDSHLVLICKINIKQATPINATPLRKIIHSTRDIAAEGLSCSGLY